MATVAVFFAVIDLWQPFREGTYGMSYALVAGAQPEVRVRVVDAGSAAARAGIVPGDILVVRGRLVTLANPDVGFPIVVIRGQTPVTLLALPRPLIQFDVEWGAIRLFTVGIALLCIFRQPRNAGALALASFLIGVAHLFDWSSYPAPLNAVAYCFRVFGTALGFPLFIVFVAYAASLSAAALRRVLSAATVIGLAYALALVMNGVLLLQNAYVPFWTLVQTLLEITIFLFGVIVLARQLSAAPPSRREPIRWMLATLAVSLSGGILYLILSRVYGPAPVSDALALTMALLPAGLAYSILRHRLLDVTFAINMVLIYGSITIIVVVAFGFLEWLLDQTIHAMFPLLEEKRTLADPLSAIIIFAALRYVHDWVDHTLSVVVFRERNGRIRKIDTFAVELSLIDSLEALAKRIPETVNRYLRTTWTAVHFADTLDANDPVVIRLRAENRAIDLEGLQTQVSGATAFPMSFGRRFYGMIVVGTTVGGLRLAPDERAALQRVATAAAVARGDILIDELANASGEEHLASVWSRFAAASRPSS